MKAWKNNDKYLALKVKRIVPRANVVCNNNMIPSDNLILRGFSASNYATITDSFAVGTNTWEMVYKIRTGSNVTTGQAICGHTGSSNYDPVALGITSGKFNIGRLATSTSAHIVQDRNGTYTVLPNTDYWIRLVFDGSKYVFSYSLNGIDYIEDIIVISSKTIYTSNLVLGREQGADSEYPFLGSIDLKGCYININGQRYWIGVEGVLVDRYLMVR